MSATVNEAAAAFGKLKANVDPGGKFISNAEVCKQASILNDLYIKSSKKDPKVRHSLCCKVAELQFPALVAEMLVTVKKKCPKSYTEDREKGQLPNDVIMAQDLLSILMLATINYTDLSDKINYAALKGNLIPAVVILVKSMKDSTKQMQKYVDRATQAVTKYTIRGKTLSRALGCLHNMSRRMACRQVIVACPSVIDQILLPMLSDPVPIYAAKALLALAYLIDEENNDKLMAGSVPIKFLINLTDKAVKSKDRRYLGFSTSELAEGLAQIAVNDKNKRTVGASGAIPVLVNMLQTAQSDEERLNSCLALWNLSFEASNREMIGGNSSVIASLKSLSQSKDKKVKKAASGVLWEVQGKKAKTSAAAPASKETTKGGATKGAATKGKHVMISYQWDHQPTILTLKKKLEKAGYRVWLDVEEMEGSTLDAMANAVENAAAFLMCMSRKYKESVNCRSEAEYAFQRLDVFNDIIPLQMEADYRPDGWLGFVLGGKLYYDFSTDKKIDALFEKFVGKLGTRGKN